MKKKTYLQVLEETVEFYSEDPSRRSTRTDIDDDGKEEVVCLYFGPDNKQCAFARHVNPKSYKKLKELEGKSATRCISKITLKEDVKHLTDPMFWNYLQGLHDKSAHWNESGLTALGQEKFKMLYEVCKLKDSDPSKYFSDLYMIVMPLYDCHEF